MKPLLELLGTALLGHLNLHKSSVPPQLWPTWEIYAHDPNKARALLRHFGLQSYVESDEIALTNSMLDNAALLALGYMYGHVNVAQIPSILLNEAALDKIACRLQGRIRIKRVLLKCAER